MEKLLKFVFRNLVDFENLHKDPLKKCFHNFLNHSPTKTILLKYFQENFQIFLFFAIQFPKNYKNSLTYYGNASREKNH